jgi:DNA (cytosine-5)-methyltransferase 1
MENVELAPIPRPEGYLIDSFILNNRWVGGIQWRKRRFTFGSKFETKLQIEVVALEAPFWHHGILGDARPIPVKLLKGGKVKQYTVRAGHDSYLSHRSSAGKSMDIKEMCELQGLPVNFCDEMPFTMHGKRQIIGNAVPIPLGRALAKAISKATL